MAKNDLFVGWMFLGLRLLLAIVMAVHDTINVVVGYVARLRSSPWSTADVVMTVFRCWMISGGGGGWGGDDYIRVVWI